MRLKHFNRLEIAIRIKSHEGALLAEHIIRGDRVELRSFFPSGQIEQHTMIGLEQLIEELEKLRPYAPDA